MDKSIAAKAEFEYLYDKPYDDKKKVRVAGPFTVESLIPLQQRIETVGDDADLQEVYDTERHLLYVACTRARDHLLITSVEPASEFLDDLRI
jgi:superfamily I DNA/RNA helicase